MDYSILNWSKKELGFVMGVVLAVFLISFWQLKTGEMKTRDAQRRSDGELVGRALDSYYSDHQVYPGETGGKIAACGRLASEACEWGGGPIMDVEGVVYLKKIPTEPFSNQGYKYVYEVTPDRLRFRVYTVLEYKNDPVYKPGLTKECGMNVQCSWYVGNF